MFVTEVHSQKTLIPTDFFKNFKEIYKWYKNQGGVRGSILFLAVIQIIFH